MFATTTITIETWQVTLFLAVLGWAVASIVYVLRLENRLDLAKQQLEDVCERVEKVEQTVGKFYVFTPPRGDRP